MINKRWYVKGNKKRELAMTPKQALEYGWHPMPEIKKDSEPEPETKSAPKKAKGKAKSKTNHPDIIE